MHCMMTLAEYRKRFGLSREELARQVAVTPITIGRYEAGRVPDPNVMRRIIKATGAAVTADDFFRGEIEAAKTSLKDEAA